MCANVKEKLNILLPLKVWRYRQRLVEILPPYQPICILNAFSLEWNNDQHSSAFITEAVQQQVHNMSSVCVILFIIQFLLILPLTLSCLCNQSCIPASSCSGHQLCFGWCGFCKLWEQIKTQTQNLQSDTAAISDKHDKSV